MNASDLTFTRSANDLVITVNSTGETITAPDQWYDSSGDNGLNAIQFADGTSMTRSQIGAAAWVRGTSGDDTIYVPGSNLTVAAGRGDDFVQGGMNDTYIYTAGDGNDTIVANTPTGSTDTLKLTNINASGTTLSRSGNDLLIGINGTGQTITVPEEFYAGTGNNALGDNGIGSLQFADGSSLTRAQITQAAWVRAGSGDTTIYLPDGTITAASGAGNDTFYGGAGNDTFVYSASNGNLAINDNAQATAPSRFNVLSFGDLNPTDVTLTRNGNDLLIGVHASAKTITVGGEFNSLDHDGVQQMSFANGTIWNRSDIASHTS